VKLNRYYVSCFNVAPVFTSDFKMPKSKGGGEFTVNYMDSAFNKEAEYGEFFIEFKEAVWEYKLVEQFESYGAGQVYTATFQNIDGGESASNALLRVWELAEKTGHRETRGECSGQLLAKAKAKLEKHREEKAAKTEDDEKLQMGIKMSLENLDGKVVDVHEDVKSIEGKVDAMQQCVVTIIPDYQKENMSLKSQLAHKTKECDRIEGQKAHQTHIINMQNGKIEILESRVKNLEDQESIWKRERATFAKSEAVWKEEIAILMQSLKNQVDTSKAISDAKDIVKIVEAERSAKRARTA